MPRNPAALVWALLIGSEARVSEQDEREVIAMSSYEQRVTAELEEHGYYSIIEIAAEADARIAELEAQLERAREALRRNQYNDRNRCVECGASYYDRHRDDSDTSCKADCELAAAIAGEDSDDKEGR